MPCFDGRENGRIVEVEPSDYRELKRIEAVLCSIVRKHGLDFVLNSMDAECGVSVTQVTKWYERHARSDQARKLREMEEKMEKIKKEKALSKLTPEERKILGVK